MAEVILGKEDWLFLTGDNSKSIEQYTGKAAVYR